MADHPLDNDLITVQRELVQKNAALEELIAKNKALEADLIQADGLKVLVQTAGAAAHEINQPLSVLLGYVQLILFKKKVDPDVAEMLTEMLDAIKQIRKTLIDMSRVRELRTTDYMEDVKNE